MGFKILKISEVTEDVKIMFGVMIVRDEMFTDDLRLEDICDSRIKRWLTLYLYNEKCNPTKAVNIEPDFKQYCRGI